MPSDDRIAQVPDPQPLRQIALAIVLYDLGHDHVAEIHGSDSAALSYQRKVGRFQDRTCHEWAGKEEGGRLFAGHPPVLWLRRDQLAEADQSSADGLPCSATASDGLARHGFAPRSSANVVRLVGKRPVEQVVNHLLSSLPGRSAAIRW